LQLPDAPFWFVMVVELTLWETLTVYVLESSIKPVTIVFGAMPAP